MLCNCHEGYYRVRMLFNIYISIFFKCLRICKYQGYADDILKSPTSNIDENVQYSNEDLNKCIMILLHGAFSEKHKKANFDIEINNVPLEQRGPSKNYSLFVSSKLCFKKHISICIRKAYSNLKILILSTF